MSASTRKKRRGPRLRDTRSLVHDVKKRRIEFLGAEINAKGLVHVPNDKRNKIRNKLSWMRLHRDEVTPIVGTSQYASGFAVGRVVFDTSDLAESIEHFRDYWTRLGAPNLEPFLGDLLIELNLCSLSTEASEPWVAYLPAGRARSGEQPIEHKQGEDRRLPHLLDERQLRDLYEEDPFSDGSPLDDEHLTDDERHGSPSGPVGILFPGDEADPSGDASHGDGGDAVCQERSAGAVAHQEEPGGGRELCPEGAGSRGGRESRLGLFGDGDGGSSSSYVRSPEDVLLHGRQPDEGDGLGGVEDDVVHVDLEDGCDDDSSLSFDPRSPEPSSGVSPQEDVGHDQEPSGGSSASGTSPEGSLPVALTTRKVFIAYEYVPEVRRVVVGALRSDDNLLRQEPRTWTRESRRHESAALDAILDEVARAARDNVDVLVIRLAGSWLPKAFVQRTRATRTVTFADKVERLHAAVAGGSLHLVLAGPCGSPEALDDAVGERAKALAARGGLTKSCPST